MTSSPQLSEAVVAAIKTGDLAQLQSLYESDMSLDEIARKAARKGQPTILEWCYTQGWKPKSPSFNDKFFSEVCSGASTDIFKVLLEYGWDLNAHQSEASGDALASAITGNNYDLAKWLLEHGHRPTPVDGIYGDGAVFTAIKDEPTSLRILKLLLQHGIDLKGTGAVMLAGNEGNLEALKLLLDYGVDTEDRTVQWYPFDGEEEDPYASEGTSLYRACRQGHLECVRLLLERGANAQAKDDGGTSCLAIAKQRGHQEIVKLLEEKGASE
ncbi:hypothetical protein HBI38_104360 [Parastagonospora nodorum]|nr:hypothetical protein HBI38_104360 [Parastagonospora nodorum]